MLFSHITVLTLQVLTIISTVSYSVLSQSNDLTLADDAVGTQVVFASIARIIESGIFPDDNRLLRRVAHVESRDGTDPDNNVGLDGGIWRVNENVFLATLNVPELSVSGGIYEIISEQLSIDWTLVTWPDLRKPLLSALAARIYFFLRQESIPGIGDVEGQGQFWKESGYNINEEDTVDTFVEAVVSLELEECPNRGIDLAFVLDSSGSVGESNFEMEKTLVSNVVQRFQIGTDATQVAVISYSGLATINFQLDNFTNSTELLQAVAELEYSDPSVVGPDGQRSTNTADALLQLRTKVFVASGGARSVDTGIPRVAVVITDGQSNVNQEMTIPMATALRESGATVYAVGVGSSINMAELDAIASSPDNVRLLTRFDTTEFDGLRSRITNDACTAIVAIEITQIINIEVAQGNVAFFELELPEEGLTISLVKQEGNADLYASDKIRNPNSAFYDFRIEEEGEIYVNEEVLNGLLQKREVVVNFNITNTTLFVSIEGIGENNVYQIRTTYGNTASGATGLYATARSTTLVFSLLFTYLSMK